MKDNDTIISLAEVMKAVKEFEEEEENFVVTDIAIKGNLSKEAVEYLIDNDYMFDHNMGMTFISKASKDA